MSDIPPEIVSGRYSSKLTMPRALRVIDWNIDRGLHLDGILNFLGSADPDVLLLQEVDINDRRTQLRNVADRIARQLELDYVWAREFQELVQGTKASPAYSGQATLSRWPILRKRIIRFRKQSGFWRPHWFVPHMSPFQVRVGGRVALACDIDLGGRRLVTYNLHLESRNTDLLRAAQLGDVLADASHLDARTPVILAGDFNMNVKHRNIAMQMHDAQFRPVPQDMQATAHFLFAGAAIDWAFVRGPVQTSNVKVHSSVHASDHFPISFQIML